MVAAVLMAAVFFVLFFPDSLCGFFYYNAGLGRIVLTEKNRPFSDCR